MEYFFLLLSIFTCGKRNVWLRQIKVLLFVLTLAKISCADRRLIKELPQPDAMCGKLKTSRIDPSCGTCGISNERDSCDFVINGTPVRPPYKYPWMVRLIMTLKKGEFHCGGSIISNNFILTAAHCVKEIEKKPHNLQIRFLTDTRKVVPLVPVSAIYCHPQYDDANFRLFDIALIRLKNKITCDKYKSPICLPPHNVILPPFTHLKIAGWGRNVAGKNEEVPNELLEGTAQTLPCESCFETLYLDKCRKGLFYCMKGLHNQSACEGDSGGPMFLPMRGKYYIEGVATGAEKQCRPSIPFLYTSVSAWRSWIRKVSGI